jgi:hypothetical protein
MRSIKRSIKELLELMLHNEPLFSTSLGEGLCAWAEGLYFSELIPESEMNFLLDYIRDNRPSQFSSWNTFKTRRKAPYYYWESGDIRPRIKWIEKHIKINK